MATEYCGLWVSNYHYSAKKHCKMQSIRQSIMRNFKTPTLPAKYSPSPKSKYLYHVFSFNQWFQGNMWALRWLFEILNCHFAEIS